jgi:AcrR family transcriptional regulator
VTVSGLDGRAARALRTREAIVDACIAMVEEGDLRPTAPRVAARAQVSVRSVFQHFDDLPSLHSAVGRRIADRMTALVVPVDPALPTAERVVAFAGTRATLLDAITPFRRAAQVHGPFSPQIREAIAQGTDFLRQEVQDTFAPELQAAGAEGSPARAELAAALAAAASWGSWDVLRSELGLDTAAATAVVSRTLRALLATGPG